MPKLPVQVGTQAPATQFAADALAVEQARPHAPQSLGSLDRSLSHPSSGVGATGWLQSFQPPAHVGAQSPPLQPVAKVWSPEHA